jgi:predicted small lipoprotein YifL
MLCYHPRHIDRAIIMTKFFAVLLATFLTACGFKGSLEKPSGPVPEPLLGTAQAAPLAPVETRNNPKPQ